MEYNLFVQLVRENEHKFWKHVNQQSSGCWEWNSSRDSQGYGHFQFRCKKGKKRAFRAHRTSYVLSNPTVNIDGLLLRHMCHNKACINPEHLLPGTPKENAHDEKIKANPNYVERPSHYYKPLPVEILPNHKDTFWQRVAKFSHDSCWIWTGSIGSDGYPLFYFTDQDKHRFRATRVSWFFEHNQDPGELFVLHRCDTPACVNPAHLFLGDAKDNSNDKITKGRHLASFQNLINTHGENHALSKLTEVEVLKMREEYALGKTSMRTLATHHSVSLKTISDVIHRRTWKHI